jgi:hypothetical protein
MPEEVKDKSPKAVVGLVYKRLEEGSTDSKAGLMRDDIVFREPPGHPNAGHWEGPEDSAEAAKAVLETLQIKAFELKGITSNDKKAVAEIRMTILDSDGEPYDVELLEQWTVIDGKITEVRPFYWDAHEIGRRSDPR